MASTRLTPCAGMDQATEDAGLIRGGDNPAVFVRDAVNINVSMAGKLDIVPSGKQSTVTPYRWLWQSPLHKDVFGLLGEYWVIIDSRSWSHEVLASIGYGEICHTVLNNKVCVSGPNGIYVFDGQRVEPLTISTPPAPMVKTKSGGEGQQRSIAISWLRGSTESALSNYVVVDGASATITLPMVTDTTVTSVNIYATNPNGGDMQLAGTASVGQLEFKIDDNHKLGRSAIFSHLSPMPAGKYLSHWRGRLITAKANIIRFSEPLAYHLHDERHGFIQMPQRITFIQPVVDGLWVGQVDHVVFLMGTRPDDISVMNKSVAAPIPDSAILINSDVSGDLSNGGDAVVLWLSKNGYVAGTSSGQVIEYQPGRFNSISAKSGTTVRLGRRIVTSVN